MGGKIPGPRSPDIQILRDYSVTLGRSWPGHFGAFVCARCLACRRRDTVHPLWERELLPWPPKFHTPMDRAQQTSSCCIRSSHNRHRYRPDQPTFTCADDWVSPWDNALRCRSCCLEKSSGEPRLEDCFYAIPGALFRSSQCVLEYCFPMQISRLLLLRSFSETVGNFIMTLPKAAHKPSSFWWSLRILAVSFMALIIPIAPTKPSTSSQISWTRHPWLKNNYQTLTQEML